MNGDNYSRGMLHLNTTLIYTNILRLGSVAGALRTRNLGRLLDAILTYVRAQDTIETIEETVETAIEIEEEVEVVIVNDVAPDHHTIDRVATMRVKTHTHPAESTEHVNAKIDMAVTAEIGTGVETIAVRDDGMMTGAEEVIFSTIEEGAAAVVVVADGTKEEAAKTVTNSLSRPGAVEVHLPRNVNLHPT